jgi:hypothetical protein
LILSEGIVATIAGLIPLNAETPDPATNIAMGCKIGYMKAILARGGGLQIEQYILTPSLKDFAIIALFTPFSRL